VGWHLDPTTGHLPFSAEIRSRARSRQMSADN
jgi:hypothetical protein